MREIKDIDKDIEEKLKELGSAKRRAKKLEKEINSLQNEKIEAISAEIMNKRGKQI